MAKLDVISYTNDMYDSLKGYIDRCHLDNLKFTVMQIGDNPASNRYIRNKRKKCEMLGINFELLKFVNSDRLKGKYEDVDTHKIYTREQVISKFNSIENAKMVQYPAPGFEKIDIPHYLDVDGLAISSTSRLYTNRDSLIPCTALGILNYMKHLETSKGSSLEGKSVLIINRSKLVGRPLSNLLTDENMFVAMANSFISKEYLVNIFKDYDYIISGIGKPHYFSSSDIPKGVTFIDVGISFKDGKMCGDLEVLDENVNFDYTPVPGGVGQLTVLSLCQNIITSFLTTPDIVSPCQMSAISEYINNNKIYYNYNNSSKFKSEMNGLVLSLSTNKPNTMVVVESISRANELRNITGLTNIYGINEIIINDDIDRIVLLVDGAKQTDISFISSIIEEKYPNINITGVVTLKK